MKETAPDSPVKRSDAHAALEVFVGRWRAEGWSYFGTDPNAKDPKQPRERWLSTMEAKWHTGEFFLIQDERQYSGEDTAGVFETHSVFGVEPGTNDYFAHNFENHGFFRLYKIRRDGRIWTFDGQTERARIEFSEAGRKQVIAWELLKSGAWMPLCDRVAIKS
jgi:hypothetical protein